MAWVGHGGVQGMDSKVPMLMEINGQFWGSLQLAIDAVSTFHTCSPSDEGHLCCRSNNAYRIGMKSRWLLGDLDHLLLRLIKSNSELHLDPDAPSRAVALQNSQAVST
jgi:hypothetical protein